MKPEIFKQELAKIGIELSEKQMNQFNIYYELLVEWNQKINLTAITELEEVYLKTAADIPKEPTNLTGKKRKKKVI